MIPDHTPALAPVSFFRGPGRGGIEKGMSMFREEVALTMAVLSEARIAIAYVLDGPQDLKDRLVEKIDEALHIMERPPEDKSADQRRRWREQKARQRAKIKECPQDSPQDSPQEVSGNLVVVEEEVVVAEEVVVPPVFVSMDDVDAVLTGWNALTGSSMRTGPTRSKKVAEQLRSLLIRLAKEEGDDVEAARRRIGEVVKWLWADRAGTELAKYVVPSTVCRKWDSYAEQITVPDNGTAGADWNARA